MTLISNPPENKSIFKYPPNFPNGQVSDTWIAWFQEVRANNLVYPTPAVGFALGWDSDGNLANVPNTGAEQTAAWTAADAVVTSAFQAADVVVTNAAAAAVALVRSDNANTSNQALGDALIGVNQPFAGAVARTQHDKNIEWVSVKDFGAIGDGVTDDTLAIKAACAVGKSLLFPEGNYLVAMNPSDNDDYLGKWDGLENIKITGHGARITDSTVYIANDPLITMFWFNGCNGIAVDGVDYKGVELADVRDNSLIGGTLVRLTGGSTVSRINAKIEDARYGVQSGSYSDPAVGGCSDITVNLDCRRVGYPIATYLADAITGTIYAEDPHRAAYIAGARGGDLIVRFKNQHVAQEVCLLTDATTVYRTPGDLTILHVNGGGRGVSDFKLVSIDVGSTIMETASTAAAINLSWGNPGTLFRNIDITVDVTATDTVATTMNGFKMVGTEPVSLYPNFLRANNQYCYYDNITVRGVVDRRAQTVAGGSANELYVLLYDTVSATGNNVNNLVFDGFKYIHGTYVTRPNPQIYTQGASGPVILRGCYIDASLTLSSSATNKAIIHDSYIYGLTRNGLLDIVQSRVDNFVSGLFQAAMSQSESQFGSTSFRTRMACADFALTGASVTVGGLLPASAIVLNVTGVLTTAITGATGFQVGVSGALDRYADVTATAAGTQFNIANWLASEQYPRAYKAATNMVVTAKTSNFTGGVLRVYVTYMLSTPPTY